MEDNQDLISRLNTSGEELDISNSPSIIESINKEDNSSSEEEKVRKITPLHHGESLGGIELLSLMKKRLVRVAVVAGLPEAGKSTLLNSFYQPLFKKGMIGNYEFAGSATLKGFEKRDQLSRISSGLEVSTQLRTKAGQNQILHLDLKPKDKESIVHLTITDISGEDYEEMINSQKSCQEFKLLQRADTFALLIDGDKLVNKTERHKVKNKSLRLLNVLLDANMLHIYTRISIIFTKWDCVVPVYEENKEFITLFQADIQRRLSTFPHVDFLNFSKKNVFKKTISTALRIDEILDSFIYSKNNWEYSIKAEKSKLSLIEYPQRAFSKYGTYGE